MALNTKLSIYARNVRLDALAPLANSGYIRIYDGAQPASPDSAVTTQNKLAELRLGSPAFGSASGGVITANAITDDPDAALSGTASWFRVLAADGTTVLWDGSVGTSGANVNLNSVAIVQHSRITLTSLTLTAQIQEA